MTRNTAAKQAILANMALVHFPLEHIGMHVWIHLSLTA